MNLSNTSVTDLGLQSLAQLTGLKQQSLADAGTHITDAGLKHLEKLANLHTVNLSRTQITYAALHDLLGLMHYRTARKGPAITS